MAFVIQRSHRWIPAVDTQCVLNQIISTERSKIRLCQKLFCTDHGSRKLNHDAHRHELIKLELFLPKLSFCKLDISLCFSDFLKARYHRQHNPDIRTGCGSQNRPDLRDEKIRISQGKTNRSQAQRRIIFFFCTREIVALSCFGTEQLVSADVNRANRHRASRHSINQLSIAFHLLPFLGKVVAAHEQIFAAEETDSLGP